jgi:hypothetical protein
MRSLKCSNSIPHSYINSPIIFSFLPNYRKIQLVSRIDGDICRVKHIEQNVSSTTPILLLHDRPIWENERIACNTQNETVKAKLSQCSTVVKAYGGLAVQIHVLLTLALAGRERSSSWPCCSNPRERALSTHWIGRCVDSRAGLDDMENLKFLPYRDSNSKPLGMQPVAGRYTNHATVTHKMK